MVAAALFTSVEYVKSGLHKTFDFGTKFLNLDGLDKVGAFAKPLFALSALHFRGEKIVLPIFEAYDGFKTIKNSVSWIKEGKDLFEKSFTGGLVAVSKRLMVIAISVLNLLDVVSKNITKALDFNFAVNGLTFSVVGKFAGKAVPLKLAIATVLTTVELVQNAYELFKVLTSDKNKSNAEKARFFAKVKDVKGGEGDLRPVDPYQAKLQDIIGKLDLENPITDLNAILNDVMSDAKKFAALKAILKASEAATETERDKFIAESQSLKNMSDDNFIGYKIQNINIRRGIILGERNSAMLKVAVNVASLVSNFFAITSLGYGMKWVASFLDVKELSAEKIVEGAAAVAGFFGILNYLNGAPYQAPVKISATKYYDANVI